jgi:hypothetical protein
VKSEQQNQIIRELPLGFKIYRNNCYTISHGDFEIWVQTAKLRTGYSCIVYFYVGGKFGTSPLMFIGDEHEIYAVLRKMYPVLETESIEAAVSELNNRVSELRDYITSINI